MEAVATRLRTESNDVIRRVLLSELRGTDSAIHSP